MSADVTDKTDGTLMSAEPELLPRDMRDTDIAPVLLIEREAHPSPWGRLSFESSLTAGHRCRVFCVNDEIVAYLIVQEVVQELHILNVTVAPREQGKGYGHDLMQDVFSYALALECERLFLEVRESNSVAQSLYEKWGFAVLSVRKQYYSAPANKTRENALVYCRTLT